MSSATKLFAVVRERQNRELSMAYHQACTYIAEDCERCPLKGTVKCALVSLPTGAVKENRVSICSDWLSLHFR